MSGLGGIRHAGIAALLLLAGCASTTPSALRQPLPDNLSLAAVQAEPDRFRDRQVRWGGDIIAVENGQQVSWVEVLARPLERGGRPEKGAAAEGRFRVRVAAFLDPAEYHTGSAFTVVGRVLGAETRPVGKYPYRYPLVAAEAYYLWPPERPRPRHDPLFDPWYYPYPYGYPWGYPYPYW
jgi:outer membrane lipoprotein